MPTDAADVCSWGNTGSDRRIGKPTRLTHNGHAVIGHLGRSKHHLSFTGRYATGPSYCTKHP